MIILIHTSKTMRPAKTHNTQPLSPPVLLDKAKELMSYLKKLSSQDIEKVMKISPKLASTTKELIDNWSDTSEHQRAAIESFLGDIYSGLQVANLDDKDRAYANDHLRIISGLYGILKPFDGIYPYRFEMGYRVPDSRYANLYAFWGRSVVDMLPQNDTIIDLTAVEYGKTVTDFVAPTRIISPKFLTISPKTCQPAFIVVHAKIARGAFAHWMITRRIEDELKLKDFAEIGYHYDETLSTPTVPVFVCQEFKGIGMSVRLT
ncbi:MAG: YaaA family protein [Candidatus Microsaccharimonas sossegonensis]|uniref:UPF0246 protein EOT05_04030 n=1 Tax=Candidatus Microsaccharimonas sossegonensis TaxID=2506948 RepID=A0A4V1J7J3_9BACT|nr:MAG: YaaA family protein [Candidatus Microsaccharimonas sossegonensis]